MRISLISFVFVLLSLASCIQAKTHYPDKPPLQTLLGESTIALTEIDESLHIATPHCTGVWVSQDTILTVSHCVEGYARRELSGENTGFLGIEQPYTVESEVVADGVQPKAIYTSTVIKFDHHHDLALLKAKGKIPPHSFVPLAKETPYISQRIYTVGHPDSFYYRYTEGYVSAYQPSVPEDDRTGPYLEANLPVAGGMSGSGVFNEDGELVALVEALNVVVPLMGYCIHLDTIRNFLDSQ